jgi:hypothetical protein
MKRRRDLLAWSVALLCCLTWLAGAEMPSQYLEADVTVGREHIPWLHQEIKYVLARSSVPLL